MGYKILPTKEFSADFNKLRDKRTQDAIKKKIEKVAEDPTRYKRLHYDLKGSFRIRIGSFRIVYSVIEEKKEMWLEKIIFDHRY
ncbi:MAG: type II toxin-antitoxin system RelE/ParE family toxin [Candidatus Aenigmarchaeota archaeon]|nr:type II toxin-antitoxin system RelE/ParE family toxin [Candidatus Aenigmarchaeota archaeon]